MRPLFIASPCGFCAGVRNALKLIGETLDASSEAPYVLRGVIHNRFVTGKLRERGVIFVDSPDGIPEGKICIFGAHGVGASEERGAAARKLRVIDATCPLVKKLQDAAAALGPDEELVLFGHRNHPEVEGVIGHSGTGKIFVIASLEEAEKLPELNAPTLLTQTTLDHSKAEEIRRRLAERYPGLKGSGEICGASFQRQRAVAGLAEKCPLVLIIGSAHSSNANRLRETAEEHGAKAYLIDSAAELPRGELETLPAIGLGAAASTPDELIREVREELERCGFTPRP